MDVNVSLMKEIVIQVNNGIAINVDVNVKKKKIVLWILVHAIVKMEYLASIIDDSEIASDEVIESNAEEIKTIPTIFNEKIITYRTKNYYILLAFLQITIVLLIVVGIYCYLIKYQAKQKQLLTFHGWNNELREVLY